MEVKKYSVEISPGARRKFDKLDADCENSRHRGKPLEGDFAGLWRYRVGDYRLIAKIQDDKIIILIINVDKRNDIYK